MLKCPVCGQILRAVFDNENICTNCRQSYDNSLNKNTIIHNSQSEYLNLLKNKYNCSSEFELPPQTIYDNAFILYCYFASEYMTDLSELVKLKLIPTIRKDQLIKNKKLIDLQNQIKDFNSRKEKCKLLSKIITYIFVILFNIFVYTRMYTLLCLGLILYVFWKYFIAGRMKQDITNTLVELIVEEQGLLQETEELNDYMDYINTLPKFYSK